MKSKILWAFFFIRSMLLVILLGFASCDLIESNLIIKSADRTINLHSQITKITIKMVIENNGKTPIHGFLFAFDFEQKDNLSYLASVLREHGRPELKVKEIKSQELSRNHPDKLFYSIEFKGPLESQRSTTVEVEIVLTHELTPYPKEISQKEKQLVKYKENLYLFTPYHVSKQTTTVILPSRNIETYTRLKPVTLSDTTITYGPFEKKAPFSKDELSVHFENNNKFLTVTKLERTIEVSHWGNIAVEETIDLLHNGALLKGLLIISKFQILYKWYSVIECLIFFVLNLISYFNAKLYYSYVNKI